MANLPQVMHQKELIGLVSNIVTCYRDMKINTEIQETEREKVRQQARVFIAQYEADTNKAIEEIKSNTAMNIELIRTIGNIMTQENIDHEIIDFCKILLEKLR